MGDFVFFFLFYAGFLGNCARPVIGPLLFLMPAAPGEKDGFIVSQQQL